MPVLLTLPLRIEHYRRVRRRRRRRLAIAALLTLGLGLLAAGFWMPAKAELAQHLLGRAWQRTVAGEAAAKPWPWADTHAPGANGVGVIAGHRDTHFRALATLELGDELTLERPDGTVLTYAVDALDVVDSERAELRLDDEESIVVLVTCWPFDAVDVGGSWRYVVTARQRF